MNHQVTIKFNGLKESFELASLGQGTRADKVRAVAIFATRNKLFGPADETAAQAYTRLRAAGLSCVFHASKEPKAPVHYVVKAPGGDMTILDKTLRTYEDARRAAGLSRITASRIRVAGLNKPKHKTK